VLNVDALLQWSSAHPIAAGGLAFAIAFFDAIVILGFLVPAVPLLFGVGTLVGLGLIDGTYAIIAAGLGAFAGDGVSFLLGRHYGDALRRTWPFSRYPEWLPAGEAFFTQHGLKGIFIARYVGAVRPLVPAVAGMLKMSPARYVPASLSASLSWGATFVLPGWLFGASLDLLAAVAGRLAIVAGVALAAIALTVFSVRTLWSAIAPHAGEWLDRALAWSHRHPVLGRWSSALIDPRQPESASLLLFASALLAAGVAFFWTLSRVVGHGEPLGFDLQLHQWMFSLRHPLADPIMATLSGLGRWQVWGPSAAVVLSFLLWRKRYLAAAHWVASIAFGLTLVSLLGAVIEPPRPPEMSMVAGFGFPSMDVSMSAVVYGFFAVLLAREIRGRRAVWPYVAATLLTTIIALTQLYFGAHWPSDILAGLTLGMTWVAVVGIAYRRRATRAFRAKHLTLLFSIALALSFGYFLRAGVETTLARFEPPLVVTSTTRQSWLAADWQQLPPRRNDLRGPQDWLLNLQYAGPLDHLSAILQDAGWQRSDAKGWHALMKTLDSASTADNLPPLPAAHEGRSDALILSRPADDPDARWVLRLWSSPLRLEDGQPVWQGMVSQMRLQHHWYVFTLWRTDQPSNLASSALARTLHRQMTIDLKQRESGDEVLLLQP
jgi:membrane protein DedA with SNARE-associated domain/membrane-associated phospholipid phosphatase